MPDRPSNIERKLIACSLWLHLGFIGATAFAAGLLELFDAGGDWLLALILMLSGGALAATSWPRARTVLQGSDDISALTPAAPGESVSRTSARHTRRSAKEQALQ